MVTWFICTTVVVLDCGPNMNRSNASFFRDRVQIRVYMQRCWYEAYQRTHEYNGHMSLLSP